MEKQVLQRSLSEFSKGQDALKIQKKTVSKLLDTDVQVLLSEVREELDEHREAINENTNEVQANYEYLSKIDRKVEKLSEMVEELFCFLKGTTEKPVVQSFSPLTKAEKRVFFALYTLTESVPYVRYRDLANHLSLSESLVASYITNLIEKGIPVHKCYQGTHVVLALERGFREEQAKKNIVGVNTLITHWV